MTLQRKFALLLVMVVLAVGVIAGTSLWSVHVLQREVTSPLASIQVVLGGLKHMQEAAARIDETLRAGNREEARALLESQIDIVETELRQLEDFRVRSGTSTTRAIRERAESLATNQRAWVEQMDEEARLRALDDVSTLTGLIERVETRTLDDMALATQHAGEVSRLVLASLFVVVASVLLAGWLGAMLVRRWMVGPVRSLREAAARFGAGDLDYRIDVQGADELAMLSSEVNAMAATIADMHEKQVEQERLAAVGEMVRRVAHNLRNPLAGIRSLAELTRAGAAEGSESAENQDRIIQTVDRFEAWVSQLLTATNPLAISASTGDVRAWIEPIVELRRAAAERMGVRLSLDVNGAPASASFDAHHLEQAVGAVIDNAIGMTPAGDDVRVVVTAAEGIWVIEVADGGPGVAEDIRQQIFTPYFTTRGDGTGLGLALARQVVEQHGGTIDVTSNSGAVFRFELPLGV